MWVNVLPRLCRLKNMFRKTKDSLKNIRCMRKFINYDLLTNHMFVNLKEYDVNEILSFPDLSSEVQTFLDQEISESNGAFLRDTRKIWAETIRTTNAYIDFLMKKYVDVLPMSTKVSLKQEQYYHENEIMPIDFFPHTLTFFLEKKGVFFSKSLLTAKVYEWCNSEAGKLVLEVTFNSRLEESYFSNFKEDFKNLLNQVKKIHPQSNMGIEYLVN